MKQKMFIHYDSEGDFLEIRIGIPTQAYYKDLGNDIFERRDEKTKKVKGYAFFNVQKRKVKNQQDLEVDLLIPS